MALIECKYCGKPVSDKARLCPSCGATLTEAIPPKEAVTFLCPECGAVLPDAAADCPFCGCPRELMPNELQRAVSETEAPKQDIKRRKNLLLPIIAVILIAAIAVGIHGSNVKKEEARLKAAVEAAEANAYEKNLRSAVSLMLDGAAQAEVVGNLVKAVWGNSIYKTADPETDKYTHNSSGSFYDDFNDALTALYSDPDFQEKCLELEANRTAVLGVMKKLTPPREDRSDAYNAVKTLYDSYARLVSLAINSSGSYNSYTADFKDADDSVISAYNQAVLYVG